LKEEQFSHLRTIVKTLLGVDVRKDRSRVQHNVNAKMIYATILGEAGYGCSVIAKSMLMNHASILHYFKNFKWYVKTDVQLRNNYERIKSEFNKNYDPIYYASENELKKELISLRIRNKELSSETEKLSLRLKEFQEKDKRLQDLFKVIQERTRVGTEDVILHKLNQFYNGIYDK